MYCVLICVCWCYTWSCCDASHISDLIWPVKSYRISILFWIYVLSTENMYIYTNSIYVYLSVYMGHQLYKLSYTPTLNPFIKVSKRALHYPLLYYNCISSPSHAHGDPTLTCAHFYSHTWGNNTSYRLVCIKNIILTSFLFPQNLNSEDTKSWDQKSLTCLLAPPFPSDVS